MLAWRLVTGSLPVDPEDNVALIKLYEGLVPVPSLEGVPEHVAVAVAAALQPNPAQRPLTAGVLARLFTAEPGPTDAPRAAQRPVSTAPAEDPRPPASGHKRLWVGLGAALASGAVFGLAVRDGAGREPPPASATASPGATGTQPTGVEGPAGFIRIEPGTFTMGSPASEEGRDASEVEHPVTLTRAFWLGRTEVTQGQWEAVMGTEPSRFSACGSDCPVENVSWDDAVAYLNALSDLEGLERCYAPAFKGMDCRGYRLPTEAEWEYAARAGTATARYGDLSLVAWFRDTSGDSTRPVGLKAANAWGLYDMLGNVWEWTGDHDGAYDGRATDPVGPRSGADRMFRGGSWHCEARSLRAAIRCRGAPQDRSANRGFRAARTAP
jgi:formylglycine-generating enzyme required for sulfatase activity